MSDYVTIDEEKVFSKIPAYISWNPLLTNFKKFSISYQVPFQYHLANLKGEVPYLGILDNAISNEVITHLFGIIFQKDDYDDNIDLFLDLRSLSEIDIISRLLGLVRHYDYCLSSYQIVQLLTYKNPTFRRDFLRGLNSTDFVDMNIQVGKIEETLVMINQNRRLSSSRMFKDRDNLIMLFNGVELNLKISKQKTSPEEYFVDVQYDYSIKDLQHVYAIENEQSEYYSEFLVLTRGSKINKIIN